ncbi:MAG TPA: efflux RND transporter periplasmic adaptor subunit, partial [Candidatus Methylomirabilis sp.]|nr:efflux RND transporter periplasmic adaptor subunit [Candidatus Methylomirabilis sp.]
MTRPPRPILVAGAIALLAALVLAGWSWWRSRLDANGILHASGRIEVTEVNVSSKVTGRVTALHVDEGTDVQAGQLIADLEGQELEAQLRQARAALQSAEARLTQARITLQVEPITVRTQIRQAEETLRAAEERLHMLKAGFRAQEIEEGRANLRQAEARLEIARLTRNRYRGLLADGAISKQDLDRSESDLQAAEAAVRAARERLNILEEGSRPEDIQMAQAERDRASAALEAARANAASLDLRQQDVRVAEAAVGEATANVRRLETQVAELKVFAPLAATVLTKAVEAGEVVAAGKPLVLLGDLDHPWIKIYVPETQLGKVGLGAPARVLVDSFPNQPFQGTVTWISDQAEFTPKNVQTAEERVNLVYAVKIMIQNAERKLKAGMPADAELPLDPGGQGATAPRGYPVSSSAQK